MAHDIETLSLRCRKACYAAFRGLPYDDIEDALQESLIEVWQSLHDHPENTQAWFVQRSVYYAKTYMRDRIWKHNNRQTVLNIADDDDESGGFPPSMIETGFEDVEADSILKHLPVQTRHIVMLLAEGYTQEEAARIIGVSRDTVKRRRVEARVSLRAAA
jgi:RNA polymerase sigma factor (sigma-70 family)